MLGRKEDIKINSILGKDTHVAGDFTAEGSVRIDGKVDGNVNMTGALIMGSTGSVSGNITAFSALIGGEVLGDMIITEKTELTATAKVLGDIQTSVIVIDEHAVFQGRCDMNQEVPGKKARPKRAAAPRAGRKSAKAALAEALKEVQEASRSEIAEESTAEAPADSPAAQETEHKEQ